jgi:cell division protein FtsB
MSKAVEEWTDGRLNDLAASLHPVPAQIAVLAAGMEQLAIENRALRSEIAAVQRQLVQISWALMAAMLAAAAAIVGALI